MHTYRIYIGGIFFLSWLIAFPAMAQDSLQVRPILLEAGGILSQPLLSPDGRYLYLARTDNSSNLGWQDAPDVWVSRRTDRGWHPPVQLIPPLNGFDDDFPAGVGLDRGWVAVLRITGGTRSLIQNQRSGRRWQSVDMPLPVQGDSTRHWFDWHLSHDQRWLVFCAAATPADPADIYLSRRLLSGAWSPPERLPAPVNSPAHEATVFLAADARGLYFSSDRAGGQGGQDIWFSRAADAGFADWSPPQNLPPPINSTGHDYDLTLPVAGASAIFVSDRSDTARLWESRLPPAVRPSDVTLVSIRAQASVPFDTAQLVVYPLEQPTLEQSFPVGSAPETQLVLPSDRSFGIYLHLPGPAFSPSRILALDTGSVVTVDRPVFADWEQIRNNRSYQQRNEIIRNLQEQLLTLEAAVAHLIRQQEEELQKMYQLRFPAIPGGLFNRNDPALRNLENRYEVSRQEQADQLSAQFTGSEYELFVAPLPIDTVRAETAQERLERLRQRYQLRQQEGYVSDTPLSESVIDSLERGQRQPPDFASFRSDMALRIQARLFDEIREEVARRAAPVTVQQIRNRLSDNETFILNRDEEQLAGYLRDLELPIRRPDTSSLQPLAAWQYPYASVLEERLTNILRPLMRSTMREPVRRYYAQALDYYIKTERKSILEQSLQQQVDEQITEEKRIGSWATQPVTTMPATTYASRSQAEAWVVLPVERPRAHQPVVLEALLFRPNQATFLAAAIPDLQRIIGYLQQQTHLAIHIQVHTHQQLSYTFAREVTRQRAQQIRQYLEQAGIAPERLHVRAMGRTRPLTQGEQTADLIRNQRVEVYFSPLDQRE